MIYRGKVPIYIHFFLFFKFLCYNLTGGIVFTLLINLTCAR